MIEHLTKEGTQALAAAILRSGVKTNDEEFLHSDWADVLRKLIELGNKNTNVTYIHKGDGTYVNL